jgi:hypothetical protein
MRADDKETEVLIGIITFVCGVGRIAPYSRLTMRCSGGREASFTATPKCLTRPR